MSLFELRSGTPPLATGPAAVRASAAVPREHAPARDGTPWWALLAIAVLGGCGLAAVNGAVVVNGDSVWHLLWGRELADGTLGSFAEGPTPHPALLALGAATSLLGDETSYTVTYVLFGPVAFGALLAGIFDVARRISSYWAAAVAMLIVVTSPEVLSIAGVARYDIAFAALVMTAVALEMARPGRGVALLALLAAAGLIRPEAWLLAGAYWLWLAVGPSRTGLGVTAMLVALAPALWSVMDLLVTGDPLYSLHATDTASAALYGRYSTWDNLEVAGRNLVWFLGVLPLVLPAYGALVLARDRNRAALPLLATLTVTLGAFVVLLAQGMASNNRYLLVPVCALAIVAAVAVDGDGRRTSRRRVLVSTVLVVLLGAQLASRADVFGTLRSDTAASHGRFENARALVGMRGVREALRGCPRVSVPAGALRPWFSLYSGRSPGAFVNDTAGRTRPDLYVAPGRPDVAEALLTRARFDDDASFTVPPGLRPGVRNADWVLYVSPAAACASDLR